jgi:hypothetical protein
VGELAERVDMQALVFDQDDAVVEDESASQRAEIGEKESGREPQWGARNGRLRGIGGGGCDGFRCGRLQLLSAEAARAAHRFSPKYSIERQEQKFTAETQRHREDKVKTGDR